MTYTLAKLDTYGSLHLFQSRDVVELKSEDEGWVRTECVFSPYTNSRRPCSDSCPAFRLNDEFFDLTLSFQVSDLEQIGSVEFTKKEGTFKLSKDSEGNLRLYCQISGVTPEIPLEVFSDDSKRPSWIYGRLPILSLCSNCPTNDRVVVVIDERPYTNK